MSRETLNTQFWKACNICGRTTTPTACWITTISLLLFLKCLEELEHKRRDEAEFEKKCYQPIIAAKYHWSVWADPQASHGPRPPEISQRRIVSHCGRAQGGRDRRPRCSRTAASCATPLMHSGHLHRQRPRTFTPSRTFMNQCSPSSDRHGRRIYTRRPINSNQLPHFWPKPGQTIYYLGDGFSRIPRRSLQTYPCLGLGDRILTRDETRLQAKPFSVRRKSRCRISVGCMNMILHGVFSSNLNRHNTRP